MVNSSSTVFGFLLLIIGVLGSLMMGCDPVSFFLLGDACTSDSQFGILVVVGCTIFGLVFIVMGLIWPSPDINGYRKRTSSSQLTSSYQQWPQEKQYSYCSNCDALLTGTEKEFGLCNSCRDDIYALRDCRICGYEFQITRGEVAHLKYHFGEDWKMPKRCPNCRRDEDESTYYD